MFNGNFVSSAKTLVTAAGVVAALGMGSGQASAATFPVFSFNPTVFTNGTTECGTLTTCANQQGDRITGSYYENFALGGGNTFTSNGFVTLDLINDQNDAAIAPLVSGDLVTYRLYATYFANGTYTVDGITGEVHFTVTSAGANLYVDGFGAGAPNTVFDTNPAGGYSIPVPDANDALLAVGSLLSGDGQASATTNASGNFGITFNPVSLTSNGPSCQTTPPGSAGPGPGCDFFTGPRPFYIQANFSGQFINFNLVSPQTLNGSADLIFQPSDVPEPATLTMFGLGLLGVARRRYGKKQA